MDRREFLRDTGLLAALIGVQVTITSCGSDDDGGGNGNPTGPGDETGTATGSGHTHSAVITRAELDAGNSVLITFSGSGHEHSFTLTDVEVQAIADGDRVQRVDFVAPSGPSHPHTFTFN